MSSSQIQQPQSPNSISIDVIELSIKNLVKNWQRRQRFQFLFFQGQDEQHEQGKKRGPWRIHLANFLESTPIRILTIFLLLLDLILTVLDLSSTLLSCTSEKTDSKRENVVYRWVGIAILSLLSTKILALAVALGSSFFKSPGHVVDGIVVIGALLLELLSEREGVGLVVVVSLWRVVRVVESAFELSDEAIEAQIEGIVSQFEVLCNENQRLHNTIVEKDKIIAELKEELDHGGNA